MTLTNLETVNDIAALHRCARECQRCKLHETRTNVVPGKGNPDTGIMLCGEAPGVEEDKQGAPFVGKAGQYLDECLEEIGLIREKVFITNTCLCRPPGNRAPTGIESRACAPYLCRHISLIQPGIIGAMGLSATKTIFSIMGMENRGISMKRIHGIICPTPVTDSLKIIPLYHPAAAIYDPEKKEILKKDFRVLKQTIDNM